MAVITTFSNLQLSTWNVGSSPSWQTGPLGCRTWGSAAPALVANGTRGSIAIRNDGAGGHGLCLFEGVAVDPQAPDSAWRWDSLTLEPGVDTGLAPAATSAGNRTANLVVSGGRVLYDWWDLGAAHHGFVEVPGGFRAVTTPAAALVGNGSYLFVVAIDVNRQLWLNQGTLGGAFNGWLPMHIYSNVPVAMAASDDRTVLVVTEPDNTVWYDWWNLGGGGHGLRQIPGGATYDPPAVGLMYGTFICVVEHAPDGHAYSTRGLPGGPFTPWTPM
jgi:hypothetical protein